MRKSFVAILVLAAVVALILFLKPRSPSTPTETAAPSIAASSQEESPQPESTASRPRWTKPPRNEVSAGETTPSKAVVYGASDFARGDLQNIVVTAGGIKMGDDPAFVPRFDPTFRRFGNFISPETDSSEPFDALNLNLQASALGENKVIFEVRTRSRFGEWSEWREVSPENMKEPITAETPQSTGWQFRVALFANDAAGSPTVETVAIEPISPQPQSFSANNNTK